MNKLTRRLIAVVAFGRCGYALSCLLVGCGVAGEPREFVIPRSLVTRMLDAHDRARDVGKDGGACFDEYGPLPSTLEVNPAGPKYGKSHVIRGGDSSSWPACCRSAARGAAVNDEAGFRPIMRRTEHD